MVLSQRANMGIQASGEFRVEPVTLSRITNDYGYSGGEFAMESAAYARFCDAARQAGLQFKAHPFGFDLELTVVRVEGVHTRDD